MKAFGYGAALISLVPLLVGLFASAWRTRPAFWLMLWCAVNLAWNFVGIALARSGTNNHWIEHYSIPLELLFVGAALATLLPRSLRSAVLGTTAVGIALVVGASVLVEDLTQFPALTGTIRSILISSGAAYLLILRSAALDSGWTKDGPCLVAAGLLVIFLPTLMVELAFRQLMRQDSGIVGTVLGVRAMFVIAGYLLIAVGMRWHSTMPPSGSAPSPLRFSPSRS